MRQVLAILLLLLGLAGPASLHAQGDPEIARAAAALGTPSPALNAFLARSSAQEAPRDFVLGVLKEARELEARGIPAEPYLLKANEGLAKGVPPAKISPALRQTRERVESAAEVVDRSVPGGARALSSPARRQAILQVQSALLNGSSPRDIEKGLARKAGAGKPSWEEIGAEARALQPRRHGLAPAPQAPRREAAPPALEQPVEQRKEGDKGVEKGKEWDKEQDKEKAQEKAKRSSDLENDAHQKKLKRLKFKDRPDRLEWRRPDRREPEGKGDEGRGPPKSKGGPGKSGNGRGK